MYLRTYTIYKVGDVHSLLYYIKMLFFNYAYLWVVLSASLDVKAVLSFLRLFLSLSFFLSGCRKSFLWQIFTFIYLSVLPKPAFFQLICFYLLLLLPRSSKNVYLLSYPFCSTPSSAILYACLSLLLLICPLVSFAILSVYSLLLSCLHACLICYPVCSPPSAIMSEYLCLLLSCLPACLFC